MRKTSRILGIIGSSLSAASGLMFILLAVLMDSLLGPFGSSVSSYDMPMFDTLFDVMFTLYYVIGGASVAAAILGFIAASMVLRNNTTAGALNIVAAVLCCMSIPSLVLFILATVYAYRKEKPPAAPQMMYAPYPPGAYPPPYGMAPGAYPPPYPPSYYGTAPGSYPPPPPPPPVSGPSGEA